MSGVYPGIPAVARVIQTSSLGCEARAVTARAPLLRRRVGCKLEVVLAVVDEDRLVGAAREESAVRRPQEVREPREQFSRKCFQ